jgi:hypothetical protein
MVLFSLGLGLPSLSIYCIVSPGLGLPSLYIVLFPWILYIVLFPRVSVYHLYIFDIVSPGLGLLSLYIVLFPRVSVYHLYILYCFPGSRFTIPIYCIASPGLGLPSLYTVFFPWGSRLYRSPVSFPCRKGRFNGGGPSDEPSGRSRLEYVLSSPCLS